jgi:hypothetical protein
VNLPISIHLGPYEPFATVVVCLSERARRAFVKAKSLDDDGSAHWLRGKHARTSHWDADIAVCLDPTEIAKYGLASAVNTIAHEATHVMQVLYNITGDHRPSEEAQAYLIGWIAEKIAAAVLPIAFPKLRV